MAVKTVTVRLAPSTYDRLCALAESSEELPSETARCILRDFLANSDVASPGRKAGRTDAELNQPERSALEALHEQVDGLEGVLAEVVEGLNVAEEYTVYADRYKDVLASLDLVSRRVEETIANEATRVEGVEGLRSEITGIYAELDRIPNPRGGMDLSSIFGTPGRDFKRLASLEDRVAALEKHKGV